MADWLLEHELWLRGLTFMAVFVLMAFWEMMAPRRVSALPKLLRWTNNLGLVLLNNAMIRLLIPLAPVALAAHAQEHGWGLFNSVHFGFWISVLLSIVALDFIIYLQHVLMHAIPNLWRLHRVHHADLDYDLTTGIRFHPIEIIFSLGIKLAAVAALGPPVVAVIIFEIVLNGMAMFNHGNVYLPKSLDTVMRWCFVTPDMHRVHHSVEDNETNSNFGFNLSIWDRLFGTYIPQPRAGHQAMTIGIHQFREPKQVTWLPGILALPFIGKITGYAINRREWSKSDET